ncbi:hypothetical protein L486_00825 [Kwoniella mangroviensis CBS 10435]|uniref:Uncharacterized protein n=1 Tax=Kwoniella mangroviensis CBS 10435 TaxID=1331196 RepID=A0A1B9J070_9TREE|nr:hypothetical protein L486_00825 [Kwoniella mangroviensis CBS 10435]
MKKTLGPVVVIDTNPARFTHNNLPSSTNLNTDGNATKEPKGGFWSSEDDKNNQATYLIFPIFAAFVLILLSSLSTPIIDGLSIANVKVDGGGTVKVGTWGWCISGFDGIESMGYFEYFTGPLKSLKSISKNIDVDYLIGSGVMHILATLSVWLTLCWTLASSGSWRNKERHAYNWTKWAFNGAGFSTVFVLIAWSLDIGMLTRMQSVSSDVLVDDKYNNSLSVKPGHSDFHNPPDSAALPPNEDSPPTWESLNTSNDQLDINEKSPIPENSVDQRGFIV